MAGPTAGIVDVKFSKFLHEIPMFFYIFPPVTFGLEFEYGRYL